MFALVWRLGVFVSLLSLTSATCKSQVLASQVRPLVPIERTSQDKVFGENHQEEVASSPIYGPMMGYVFDDSRKGLRRILGIPGAATLGDVMDIGVTITRAWISPRQDYVLVKLKERQDLAVLYSANEHILIRSIGRAASEVESVILSPTGNSAIFKSSNSDVAEIVSNLPNAVSTVSNVDISRLSSATAVAISDDAEAILIGVQEGETGSLYLMNHDGQIRWIAGCKASAISFLKMSHDALVATHQPDEVLLIRDVNGPATMIVLADERDGISRPLDIQASEDNETLLIVNSGSKAIGKIDLRSGETRFFPCECDPVGFFRLRGNGVFRLTELSSGSLFLFEDERENPRTVFVPFDAGSTSIPRNRGQWRRVRTR